MSESPLILVTGAAGKTGRGLLGQLLARGLSVRAWVRSEDHSGQLPAHSNLEVHIGDMAQSTHWRSALEGVGCVYHIAPNMHPSEAEMGAVAVEAAAARGRPRFVLHSVLHPQSIAMPHHERKLRVEAKLIDSGLDFTILQPAAYMQNLKPAFRAAKAHGKYRPPYPESTVINLVDLSDVVEAAANVIQSARYGGSSLELAGPDNLSQHEIAASMAAAIGAPVTAQAQTVDTWADGARKAGMAEGRITDFVQMFNYYAGHGFVGNARVLEMVLGRPPRYLAEILKEMLEMESGAGRGSDGSGEVG
jgi:NAD(P)H dehydrogenase (quinone)